MKKKTENLIGWVFCSKNWGKIPSKALENDVKNHFGAFLGGKTRNSSQNCIGSNLGLKTQPAPDEDRCGKAKNPSE